MKHYTVFYIPCDGTHKGEAYTYWRFYASICETQGEALIAHIKADLTERGIEYKTQCHWDCDTASYEMDE